MIPSRANLGVIFHPSFPPESLADYARRAETAGFDELWLWDDCFLPGAFTSAAIALSATRTLKVGIGLLPATAYNPLFAAMEITTLARAFPDRIMPGFGHGVGNWMSQIGAAPKSSIKTLGETVKAVRQLLNGEMVTTHTAQVDLDRVQMQMSVAIPPPIYVGAMREKTIQLAGRVADGTILDAISSPDYVRWAWDHIRQGMDEGGRNEHRVAVYCHVKVNPNREMARATARKALAQRWPWPDCHVNVMPFAGEVNALAKRYDRHEIAAHIPDEWVDAFSAAGAPEEAAASIQRLFAAGANTVVFQPLEGDPDCLDEYTRYLLPLIREQYKSSQNHLKLGDNS